MPPRFIVVAALLAALSGCEDETAPFVSAPPPKPAPCAAAPIAEPTPALPAASAVASTPAAPTPAPTPSEPEADADAPLRVKRLVLARGVEGREPVGAASSFERSESDRVYAFVEVENPESAESAVLVSFARKGERERGEIRLRVGPSHRWRTWAFTRQATSSGDWEVVVRNLHGVELARKPFVITEALAAAATLPPRAPDPGHGNAPTAPAPSAGRPASPIEAGAPARPPAAG